MLVRYCAEYLFIGMDEFDPTVDEAESFLVENCGSLDLSAIMSVNHVSCGLTCHNVNFDIDEYGAELTADLNIDGVEELEKLADVLEQVGGMISILDDDLSAMSVSLPIDALEEFDKIVDRLEFFMV